MPNYRLTLCYDGTRWKGWQKQGNTDHTIQGKLETLLSRLLDQPIEVAASGRTDAGTHAKRQVVSFRAKTALTTQEILDGLRRYLPADIGAVSLEQVEPRFHARFSCTGKTYNYKAFCALKRTKKSTVRRVDCITIQELGPELLFTFEGNGFLYHMVRILVGTLLEVGRGNLRPEEMGDILVSQDRKRAGETVPACGLCLVDVRYEKS